jgi:5'-3' exonuclease
MGVPFLFKAIVEKYPNIILNTIKQTHRLFIDFNASIHACSAAVISRKPTDYTNLDIFNEIIKYILTVVDIRKPTELLYLAVDGIAPLAKIQQQRRRRYLSAYRNLKINEFKNKNNLPVSNWDSNCITPGTPFMIELDLFLKNYFKENKFPFNVILSSHTEAGEGEHKMIKYIKESNKKEFTDVIIGLDADLIFLSLGCDKSNIYLMRESEEFEKNITSNISSTIKQLFFKYVDINLLKKHISQFLYDKLNFNNLSYMYDFIGIMILVGNDFIPSMSFLKLKNSAVDILADVYKKVFNQVNQIQLMESNNLENLQHLIENKNGTFIMNHSFLVKMLDLFTKLEDNCMKELIEYHSNILYNPNRRFNTKLERFMYEYENMPLINRYPDNINPHTDSNWRVNYYHHLFGSHSTDIMKSATINYLEGLMWTINYYFNMSCDNLWYYQYDYSPCVSDLYKYSLSIEAEQFKKMQVNLLKTNPNEKNINCNIQMLMVLPPQSIDIVPSKLKEFYSDINKGCVHFFPTQFNLSTFLKTQTWECVPILPKLNLKVIQKALNSLS